LSKECARKSSIFRKKRVEVIPNGLDIENYKPFTKRIERKRLGLSQDNKLILFEAISATSDKRKRFNLLRESLNKLTDTRFCEKLELVVLGASEPAAKQDLGMKIYYMGHVHDKDALVSLYAAVDVFIAPSTQENLSNMVMESMACGIPVFAFDIGDMPDMIEHKKNGYLARQFETGDWLKE